jgi:glycosyltransferase involved in cell wall biosynthesis
MREILEPTIAAASRLIAVSRPIAERLVDMGAHPDRVTVVPNGIDATVFRPNPLAGEAVRQHVGCGPGERLVVTVGRLEHVKGHDIMIEALAILARAVRVRAVIIGEGRDRDRLEDLAHERGIGDRVLFAGAIAHDALSAWYSAADVFCLPSRSEGHPNALVESLACGTPAVSSAVGAAGEVLSPECGLLVQPEDPAALATALAASLTRTWDRARVRARVAGRSWERVAASVRDVFEEALHGRSVAPVPSSVDALLLSSFMSEGIQDRKVLQ